MKKLTVLSENYTKKKRPSVRLFDPLLIQDVQIQRDKSLDGLSCFYYEGSYISVEEDINTVLGIVNNKKEIEKIEMTIKDLEETLKSEVKNPTPEQVESAEEFEVKIVEEESKEKVKEVKPKPKKKRKKKSKK